MFLLRWLSSVGLMMLASSMALAQSAAHATSLKDTLLQIAPMILLVILVFYFMSHRPQSKRAKEQRSLMENLKSGDEVVTIGGIVGAIEQINDKFIVIKTSHNGQMKLQKSAIASVLPKGTIDSIG